MEKKIVSRIIGKQSLQLVNNPYIIGSGSIVGSKEAAGPMGQLTAIEYRQLLRGLWKLYQSSITLVFALNPELFPFLA